MSNPLSCYVLTKNSERRLAEVLTALIQIADDLVIIDSGSSDATESISKIFGARFIYRKFDNFKNQRNFALTQCENDWVFEIDSDEVASPSLIQHINRLKATDFIANDQPYDAFAIRRNWYFLGREVHCFYPVQSPDYPARLYRKSIANYDNSRIIHESVTGYKSMGRINEPILHYSCDSIDQMYEKINRYTTLIASDMHANKIKSNWIKILIYPWLSWLQYMFLKGGWRDGSLGFIQGRYIRDTVWQKYVKLKYDYIHYNIPDA